MRKFLAEVVALFFAGFVYGLVIAYLMYHGRTDAREEAAALPLGAGVGVGAVGGVAAIITALLARLFPVGLIGRVFFNALCGAAVFAVAFGTKQPNKDVPGLIMIGYVLGLFTGLLEAARQRRAEERTPWL